MENMSKLITFNIKACLVILIGHKDVKRSQTSTVSVNISY